jgi:Holliday junction DNA helicase RuvB
MEMIKEADLGLLTEIAKFEKTHDMEKEYKIGWGWRHVRIWPATLSRLFKDGYLENVFRSNSHTGYRLSELGKAVIVKAANESLQTPQNQKLSLPDDLFEDIIGHDEVKELLRACLMAEKPVHVLLAGPPALAKTLFLWDIERVTGEKAIWLAVSASCHS